MPIVKFEDYLAPWEADKDGKKLDEPAEIDPARLKKYLHGLLSDKDKLQSTVTDKDTEIAQLNETITTIKREGETKEQAAERERLEREKHYEKLEKKELERSKVDALSAHFEEQGITAAQARKLAGRIKGDDEQTWIADATELVEDGFKIGTTRKVEVDDVEDGPGGFNSKPQVVRADGKPPVVNNSKKRSVTEELAEAIPVSTW